MIDSKNFNRPLFRWYKKNKREFEWRKTKDPWKILLIETLSQQTQIERADKYYKKFIIKYPDPKSMAVSKSASILRDWSGLGYNNRAIRLQEAAKKIYKDGWSNYVEDLSLLPGVGDYTKSAIESFALGKKVIAVDTNILRVLRRFYGKKVNHLWIKENTNSLLLQKRSRDWNEAIMDLASLVCTKELPKCDICPLEDSCMKYFFNEKKKHIESFKNSSREKRGKILKELLESRELKFHEISKLIKLNQKEMMYLLNKMREDKLIEINENKRIVILTKR